ncbi:contact-dependent growth inhibition system immunity protein [Pseudomonas sp. SWRI99]|uniref:contact-dependent growth inhibition system immunity protein n=1 Tax=Pseudomonas sp. SWRI99 TaxID=2745506 RepID=UPI001646C42C|nr:contact-dependent growth inhibition system immunity protein [Pseudomonas sp. SWRI99]MBC3778080.1 hypothetical protein [Pseudomonas sp. SWRI99]
MTNEDFPALFQFLGAYFHEDWMCESNLADEIVNSFINDSALKTIEVVAKEIQNLLDLKLSETVLRDFLLKEIGCSYCYWHEWQSGEQWLRHVAFKLQQP